MNTAKLLRLAVASDLHAHSNHAQSPSHLNASAPEDFATQHPIVGLLELIKRDSLTATALLCPGDLGHQADPSGIRYAWSALDRVASALGVNSSPQPRAIMTSIRAFKEMITTQNTF